MHQCGSCTLVPGACTLFMSEGYTYGCRMRSTLVNCQLSSRGMIELETEDGPTSRTPVWIPVPTSPRCGYDEAKPTNYVLHRLLTACRIAYYALTILYALHIHYALLYTLCTAYTLTACHIAASAGSQHSEFSSISARKSRRRFCIRLCCSFCLFAVARLRALAFSICFVKPGVCTRCARAAFAPLPWWCSGRGGGVVVVVVVWRRGGGCKGKGR
jgi:hypothetical protein